jgi:nucleotide sugar dehydrogenase
MFNHAKIGIVGLGFVGNAVKSSFDMRFDVDLKLIDIDLSKGNCSYQDLKNADAVFICVPSPTDANGNCDTSILESVLENLKLVGYKNLIISKVTAVPAAYERLQEQFPNLVHIPEFLTAANAEFEYLNEKRVIIGGAVSAYRREAERIIKISQKIEEVYFCSIGEAALSKYIVNTFLATKVVFMNEMYKLTEIHGYNWDNIRQMISSDKRMGTSHMQVPGLDGTFGFGGMCFPKDTQSFLNYAISNNTQMNVLEAAIKKNLLLRLTNLPK